MIGCLLFLATFTVTIPFSAPYDVNDTIEVDLVQCETEPPAQKFNRTDMEPFDLGLFIRKEPSSSFSHESLFSIIKPFECPILRAFIKLEDGSVSFRLRLACKKYSLWLLFVLIQQDNCVHSAFVIDNRTTYDVINPIYIDLRKTMPPLEGKYFLRVKPSRYFALLGISTLDQPKSPIAYLALLKKGGAAILTQTIENDLGITETIEANSLFCNCTVNSERRFQYFINDLYDLAGAVPFWSLFVGLLLVMILACAAATLHGSIITFPVIDSQKY